MNDSNHGLHAQIAKVEKSLCSHQIARDLEKSMAIWRDVLNKQVRVTVFPKKFKNMSMNFSYGVKVRK